MVTPTERLLRDILRAQRDMAANWSLRHGMAAGGVALAYAMASRRAEREAGWVQVNHAQVAAASSLRCDELRVLVRAMVGDSLIARREARPIATSAGYRSAVFLRSLVGPELLDLLKALACWNPDWGAYMPCQAPRPPRSHVCPHCGATGVQIVTSCLGCGVVLDERIERVPALVNGDGEPPG